MAYRQPTGARHADDGGNGRLAGTPTPALVHDYLLTMRGAERTFAALAAVWPDAPLFTLLFDGAGTNGRFAGRRITTSGLQRLRIRQDGFRRFLPLFPAAAERLPVGDHPLVVSSSSAFALGVHPGAGAVHICYCHSPFRYAWHHRSAALSEVPWPARAPLAMTLQSIRNWDRSASNRVTRFVANSATTQQLIARAYERPSTVVHPPVEIDRFAPGEPDDFFLVVCELVRHKRVEVALRAARMAGVPLRIVGQGPELERLKALYGDRAEFLGHVPDAQLAELYPRARALLVPSVEEFGIAAVEAQAAGRPVVAVAAGGTLETVREGETGVLVGVDDAKEMAEALSETDFDRFDADRITANARRFSVERFQAKMAEVVSRAWAER